VSRHVETSPNIVLTKALLGSIIIPRKKATQKDWFLALKLASDHPTLHCEFYLFIFFLRAMPKQLAVKPINLLS
jgi:hypothetical protein